MQKRLALIFFAVLLSTVGSEPFAQQCSNRFSSLLYRGISFDSFTCATTSRTGEVVAAAVVDADQGIFTKFSIKGTPLFSYQYWPVYQFNTTYYKRIAYSQIIQTRDGGFLLAGNGVQDKWIFTAEYVNRVGILLKTDAYGNVLWCKRFESERAARNNSYEISVTNVVETTSGDLIVYLASDYSANYPAYGRLVCLTATGSQKWNVLLAAAYDGGVSSLDRKRGLLQTREGDVVVADIVYQTDRRQQPVQTLSASIHFFAVNAVTGSIKWETNYAYPLPVEKLYPDIVSASQLPDGNLVFTTSFAENSAYRKKALRIVINNKGEYQSALSYQLADNSATRLLSVTTESNGNQTLLLKTTAQSILAKVDAQGGLLWAQGLTDAGGLFPANYATLAAKGHAVLCSNFRSRNVKMLMTDTAGVINCANEAATITVSPFILQPGARLLTEPNIPDQNRFGTADFAMRADAYPFEKTIDCEAQPDCCNDVLDSATRPPVNICEGSSFTLPDNTTVTKSGTYYLTYKTALGCDSVVYYKIKADKNPAALSLGQDLCFEGKDSVTLQASEGYENYFWMNTATAAPPVFTVRQPGVYFVRVSNICGSKTDSVSIFTECNFPIYIPSAFSPNSDGRNDVFKIPAANKNKLLSLKIFNRWGELIFFTNDVAKGWDGNVKSGQQASGVFVYYVEMEGLSGKKLSQSGTLLLLR